MAFQILDKAVADDKAAGLRSWVTFLSDDQTALGNTGVGFLVRQASQIGGGTTEIRNAKRTTSMT